MATIYEDVETLKQQMTAVQASVSSIQSSVSSIQSDVSDAQSGINDLTAEVQSMAPVPLENGNDLDDLTEGIYYIPSTIVSASILNKPTESNATAVIQVLCGGDLALLQRYFPADKAKSIFWERTYYGGTWGTWHTVDHTDSGWIDLPLASGIYAHNASAFPCKYRKIGNKVYVRGCVKGFTDAEKVVAILPEGFRPVSSYYMQKATDGGKTDTFNVRANGEIRRMSSTQTAQAVDNYHFIDTEFLVD